MDSNVSTLCSMTGVPPQIAAQFLDMAGGNIELAASLILEQANEMQGSPEPARPLPVIAPSGHSAPSGTSAPKPKPAPAPRGIVGFGDMKKEPNDDDKRDSYYAGGEKSGIAVLDPTAKRDDIVKQVFDSAKKQGAVEKHELPPEEKEKFGGVGYTLGDGNAGSQVVAPKPKAPGLKTVVLTFWSDCFTVDDGPPRKFSDPENAGFIRDVQKGIVPKELHGLAQGADLNIELVQKNEEYKPPPKPKVVAFSGSGFSLGNDVKSTQATKAISKVVQVDESQPTTTIQVRLHNGEKLVLKLNHTHTIGDIRSKIEEMRPSGKPMELRLSYPNKVLSDDKVSIKDAGLMNAAIVQRYV